MQNYIPVVSLSTQGNIKLLKQLESGCKKTINWNKYLCKPISQAWNSYLDVLICASFQGVNTLFVLSFKNEDGRESYKQNHIPTAEIKYNIMINGRNFFDQPIKNDLKTYNIRKIEQVKLMITQLYVY